MGISHLNNDRTHLSEDKCGCRELRLSLPSPMWTGTSQQDVSEGLGVAHSIEPSDFDQLAPEYNLQAFVAVKVSGRNVVFNR